MYSALGVACGSCLRKAGSSFAVAAARGDVVSEGAASTLCESSLMCETRDMCLCKGLRGAGAAYKCVPRSRGLLQHFSTTRSTFSGRSPKDATSFACSQDKVTLTLNTDVYGNKNSSCLGNRLNGFRDLASVMPSNLNKVPPLENFCATSLFVVDDEG